METAEEGSLKMGSEDGHVCAECNQQIKGAAMKAKERFYCETTCFKCVTCNVNLREIPVYCKEDSLYCEEHYKSKFIPKCAKCADYITEVRPKNPMVVSLSKISFLGLHPCIRLDLAFLSLLLPWLRVEFFRCSSWLPRE